MTGTVTVVDEGNNGSTSAANFDTIGALMVPSEDSSEIAQRLRTAGFGVDSMVIFKICVVLEMIMVEINKPYSYGLLTEWE